MPELPEVEVLVRHLRRTLRGARLEGAAVRGVRRRGKWIIVERARGGPMLFHLGMTGRLYVQSAREPLHAHVRARFDLGRGRWLAFHDPRRFGRVTRDLRVLDKLGPEPFALKPAEWQRQLARRTGPIKAALLDQHLVAGIGNIYASESLWRARIHPRTPCHQLTPRQILRLHRAINASLRRAIRFGSSIPLLFKPNSGGDALFYYGSDGHRQRRQRREFFAVYDREGKPCRRCRAPIQRAVLAGRSTFFCRKCQR